MSAFWDMMPTFCDILSSDIQTSAEALDGISLLPVLTGQKGQKEHDYLYFEFQEQNGKQAVRKGVWKLIYQNIRGDKPYYELYNLAADPSERHNVIDRFPDIAAELKEVMKEAHVESEDFPLL